MNIKTVFLITLFFCSCHEQESQAETVLPLNSETVLPSKSKTVLPLGLELNKDISSQLNALIKSKKVKVVEKGLIYKFSANKKVDAFLLIIGLGTLSQFSITYHNPSLKREKFVPIYAHIESFYAVTADEKDALIDDFSSKYGKPKLTQIDEFIYYDYRLPDVHLKVLVKPYLGYDEKPHPENDYYYVGAFFEKAIQ
ncbi:hypothetical protein [Limnovirga soli]|uniref:Lipoprotein n=1 Tax=Limnovirga soli TaxID=2656915 RepID=A0A8J8FFZ9_9BACT|nr:hypothetical protein [Limnovirga soli]NNV57208.1 hypothetical protein [Limnovirga soli]